AIDIVAGSGLTKANYGLSVTSGDVMIGNNTPTAPLTITTQTAALPTPNAGAQMHMIGANSTGVAVQWNAYAANGSFIFERADGGLGTETALAGGDVIGALVWRGYNGSAYSGNQAVVRVATAGAWSGTNEGAVIQFLTTAQGGTSNVEAMSIYAGVVVGPGTTDPGTGNLTVGGSIGIGTAAPTAPLTITTQTAALPTPVTGTQIHLIASNSAQSNIQWNAYASSGNFYFYRADGGLGTEAALAAGETIGAIGWRGYNGSAYATVSNAQILVATAGAWSGTNTGTILELQATPTGSTSRATVVQISGGVWIGSGSDPGAGNLAVAGAQQIGSPTGGILGSGTLNVAGGIYLNNSAYTNPDFVFERYFSGKIEKYADRPRAATYRGLMALDDLAAHVRETLRLPGIDDRPADIFERGDIALEKLEEHALYILQLHRRLLRLEPPGEGTSQ
ncbi:MAG TPA: hypothetical protein VMV19_15255, partial [Xanthobacteraceae bacterium]|nr:hypothetical protein [Xanthobacteraceae bacterium]